jgi:hypothetical protein
MGIFEGELATKIDFSCFVIEKGRTSRKSISLTAFYPYSMRYSWLAKSLSHPDPVVRFTVTMSKIASGKTHQQVQHRLTAEAIR